MSAEHPPVSNHHTDVVVVHRSGPIHFHPASLSLHVPLHVQCEVVRPGEGPFTQVTPERPVSGVLPEVACELVRASELPAAALPAAVVRFLSCRQNK